MKGVTHTVMNDTVLQEPLSHIIAEHLRQRIWSKDIHFGDRLVESDLAEEFDVSRSTIREALRILEHEELVMNKARKGTYVATFSKHDVEEIIELRTLLETEAFMQALPHLEEQHFKTLNQMTEQMKVKADEENWNDLFDLDMQFHGYIVHLCSNSRIIKIYNSLQIQIRTYLVHLDQYYSSFQSFHKEHVDLLAALLTKDSEIVKEKVKNHITYVEENLLGVHQL